MNPTKTLFRNPLIWTLGAGFAVGALCVASLYSGRTPQANAGRDQAYTARTISNLNTDSMASLKALDSSFAALAEYVRPAVVHIYSESKHNVNAMGELQPVGGEGSGFIYRPNGYILTNDHVVGGFESVKVVLNDGREFPGKVIRAEESDIAIVKIDANNLPTLPMADSTKTRQGEFAMAIGAPFGFDNTVTIGHVSAIGRTNRIPDPRTGADRSYGDLIQTDASINMGNSGGPLVNIDGQVIGVNTAIFSPSGMSGGIGFAISSNEARLLADTLIEKGKVTRSYLGVYPENLKEYRAKELGLSNGAVLTHVESNSPAAMAGLKDGDVVTQINDTPITSQADLRNSMLKYAPGSKLTINVVRDKEHRSMTATTIAPPPSLKVQSKPASGLTLPPGFEDVPGFKDLPGVPNKSVPSADGKVHLGVMAESVSDQNRKQFHIQPNVTGAVVISVQPGSIAEDIEMQPGDVIQAIGDQTVTSAAQLTQIVQGLKPGDSRMVRFSRYSKNGVATKAITVTF